ncbi:MAG: hypothetical protein ABJC26_11685 [Gemmatimonadaceae bacterium]
MPRSTRMIGGILVAISVFSALQMVREILFWEYGEKHYGISNERYAPQFSFAGHEFSVTDNLSVDTASRRKDYSNAYETKPGFIQVTMDGLPLGALQRAEIRHIQEGTGRYYGWYSAQLFLTGAGRDSVLYIARRIQPDSSQTARFEIRTIASNGTQHVRMLHDWQLDWDFRDYMSTSLLAQDSWLLFPLSAGAFGMLPFLWIIFPIAPFVIGIFLFRRKTKFEMP